MIVAHDVSMYSMSFSVDIIYFILFLVKNISLYYKNQKIIVINFYHLLIIDEFLQEECIICMKKKLYIKI